MKKPSDPVPMNHNTLTAREVYQVLRDIALGIRVMRRVDRSPQPNYGLMIIEVDGWVIRLYGEGERWITATVAIARMGVPTPSAHRNISALIRSNC